MIKVYKITGDHLTELWNLSEFNLQTDIGWIDLYIPTREEDKEVEDFLKISIPTKEDMQEIELSARLYAEKGAEYMTMLAVTQMNLDDPVKTPVTFILHGNAVVTVRYSELISFTQYTARAQKKNGVVNCGAGGLMLDIIESLINRIADSLEEVGEHIDTISGNIFRPKKMTINRKTDELQVLIRKVGAKGDLISMLRESLASISRLMSHYQAITVESPQKILKIKMGTLNRDVSSLNDHAAFLSSKMNFLLEATLGMINLDQNQIIKIFSIAAVVFLPPTLIASIYGMNFEHMPELALPYAYPVALVAMGISALIPLVYFKKKGWL